MSDCRVPMSSYEIAKGGERVRKTRVREFEEFIAGNYARFGDWDVHEWGESGKCFAKLFVPNGFVTIEDYTWKGQGFTVCVRLNIVGDKCGTWACRSNLHRDDGTLDDAVAWACSLAGVETGCQNTDKDTAAFADAPIFKKPDDDIHSPMLKLGA